MAELVCDFEQVKIAGEALNRASYEYEAAIRNFPTNIESDLASWKGSSKDNFSAGVESQVNASMEVCEQVRSVGEFITNAANSIETMEEELASQSI